jgi:ankyrin repeat protein
MSILSAALLLLAGCGQSPQSATIEAGDSSTDSRPAGNQNEFSNEPIAESRPSNEPASTLETQKAVIDVEAFGDAALNGNIETVRQAIEGKVDVNATDDQRRTALMLASFNGHTPVVELLLEASASVDHRDASGRTALMFAATSSNVETVKTLLDAGAEVNAVDSGEGFTALMHAAAEGQVEVVKVLLEHNADPDIRDVDGDTARDFAAQNGHAEVVRLLSK